MSPVGKDVDRLAMKETMAFVDDLDDALNVKIKIPPVEFDSICICGMGGSAIGGDIIINMLSQSSDVPISIIRSTELPNWANKRTFIISCSYSGNTEETLSMYHQAQKRGCPTVVISSGGHLMDLCIEDGNAFLQMKKGVQPRNALGMILGYMANTIETIGGAECKKELRRLMPELRRLMHDIGPKNPDSRAMKVAHRINGTVPVIYASTDLSSSVIRWKTQLNETSKMLAFNGAPPDSNQNEIGAWAEGATKYNCCPIILYEKEADRIIRDLYDSSVEMLRENGIEPVVIEINGTTVTERCLRSIMFGDFVSLYAASLNGVDPIEVNTITALKQRIAKYFKGRKKEQRQ